ncbi:MAG: Ig-like domain-containing protein [Spirochaetia bacterium]|nr:Ig-like domain-containing protein [Spirochaetia bacterium]
MDRRRMNPSKNTRATLLLVFLSVALISCQNPLSEVVREEVKYAKALSFTLNVEDATNAEVSPKGTFNVKEGYPETIKVFPENGYFFIEWEVDTSSSQGTVSFSDANSATVEVTVSGGDATIRPVIADSVGSIEINGGAQYSTTPSVSLELYAENGNTITDMRISNSGTYADDFWQDYSTSSAWTLTSSSGAKTVYAWFKDDTGTVSPRYSDSIILDVDPPQVSSATPSNGASGVDVDTNVQIQFNEPVNAATVTTSTLRISRTSGSNLGGTSVSYNSTTRVATLTLSGNLDYNNESYTVEVSTGVEDLAGNSLAATFSSSFTTKYKEVNITFLDSVSSTNPYFEDFVVEGDQAFVISRNLSGKTYGRLYRINLNNINNIAITENYDIRTDPETILSDGSYVYIGHGSDPIRKVNINDFSDVDYESSNYTNTGLIAHSGNGQLVKVYSNDLIGVFRSNLGSGTIYYDNWYLNSAKVMETMGGYTYIGSVYYDNEPLNTLQAYDTTDFSQGGATLADTQSLDSDLSNGADITSIDQYDGEYMVIGNSGTNGIVIYDVTVPSDITYDRSVNISGVEDVSVWDQYAAVARGGSGIGFVDLRSSSNQILVSAQIPDVSGEVHDIYFDGTYIYLLSGSNANSLTHFQVYEVEIY